MSGSGSVRNTLPPKGDNDELSDQDNQCHTQHAEGMAGVLENRMVGAEYAGIKQVPELEHHEYREEDRKVMHAHSPLDNSPPGRCLKQASIPISITKKPKPTPKILLRIAGVMIKSVRLRGFRSSRPCWAR